MDFNIILLFKSSLMNYLNSVGIKIKESDIKMFNSNNDICIYSRQFVDETIHHLLYNMKEEQYQLSISKIFINKCKLSIDLNRSLTFTCGLKLIFSQSSLCSFGNTNLHKNKVIVRLFFQKLLILLIVLYIYLNLFFVTVTQYYL